MTGYEQSLHQLVLYFEGVSILLVVIVPVRVRFLQFPQFLLVLIEQDPSLPNNHLAMLNSENERKYLHVL